MKNVVQMRKTSMTDYRLEQVADYLCTIELAALKYAAKEDGGIHNKFFGGIGAFKRNWLKQACRKRLRWARRWARAAAAFQTAGWGGFCALVTA